MQTLCYQNDPQQQFKFEDMGNGYKIVSPSGRNWDISSSSGNDGAHLCSWDSNNGDNQRFWVIKEGKYWKFMARHDWKCIDLSGGNKNNGAIIQQWDCSNGNDNQLYSLVDVTQTNNGGSAVNLSSVSNSLKLVSSAITNPVANLILNISNQAKTQSPQVKTAISNNFAVNKSATASTPVKPQSTPVQTPPKATNNVVSKPAKSPTPAPAPAAAPSQAMKAAASTLSKSAVNFNNLIKKFSFH